MTVWCVYKEKCKHFSEEKDYCRHETTAKEQCHVRLAMDSALDIIGVGGGE